MRIAFLFISIMLTGLFVQGQAPIVQWEKSFGGTGNDAARSIKQTTDGGYIIAGDSYSIDGDLLGNQGLSDFWIVKTDSLGIMDWQTSLGGSSEDIAYSVQQTNDQGYIVSGSTASDDGDVIGHHGSVGSTDYWIVKLDSLGSLEWTKTLGGTGSETAHCIQQTTDGGYIVAGSSGSSNGDVLGHLGISDYWVVKLDTIGEIQWQKSLGGSSSNDYAYSIQQTSDGGYIVAGSATSNGNDITGHHGAANQDYWVVKLDEIGTLIWQKSLGGAEHDTPNSIIQTTDGGYLVAGETHSNDGDVSGWHTGYSGGWPWADGWIVKLNDVGSIMWQKCLGGSNDDGGTSVQQTSDGGYMFGGASVSTNGDVTGNHGLGDYWSVKLDVSGNIEWQKTLGGTESDQAYSTLQTNDGGYIMAGRSRSNDGDVTQHHGTTGVWDYWLVKFISCNEPEPSISANGPIEFCDGDSVILTSSISDSYTWSNGLNTQSISILNTDTYSVTVSDENGCEATSSVIEVTVNPLPVVPIISASGSTAICEGDSILLTTSVETEYLWFPNGETSQSIYVSSADDYHVVVENSFGCSSTSLQTTVVVNPLPVAPEISLNGSTLESNVPNGNQWYFEGVAIIDETNQNYTPTQNGYYYVLFTDNNGCQAFSDSINLLTVGISANDKDSQISIFPNPALDKISIQAVVADNYRLELYNAVGKLVDSSVFYGKLHHLTISEFNSGFYLLSITNADGRRETFRILKE